MHAFWNNQKINLVHVIIVSIIKFKIKTDKKKSYQFFNSAIFILKQIAFKTPYSKLMQHSVQSGGPPGEQCKKTHHNWCVLA